MQSAPEHANAAKIFTFTIENEATQMTDIIDDPAAQAVRRPPQSINSEQSILGGLMIDNNALDSIVDIIQPDDFYRRDHKIIYEHIAAMIQRGRPADSLTVAESLRDAGLETDTGGFAYLAELVNNTPSAANIRRYAEIVHDKSVLRQLISAGDHMVTCALQPEGRETAQILDEAERTVLAINERNSRGQRGFQPMATLVREVSEKIIDLYQNQQGSEVTGVPTATPTWIESLPACSAATSSSSQDVLRWARRRSPSTSLKTSACARNFPSPFSRSKWAAISSRSV